MKARIYSNTNLIGSCELQIGDYSMGGMFGFFSPTGYYFEKIQRRIWNYHQNGANSTRFWDSLGLNVQLDCGVFLFPQGGFTIDDTSEYSEELIRIDVMGVNLSIIQDFTQTKPPRTFIQAPWRELQIGEKIKLEEMLRKKIHLSNILFFGMKSPALNGFDFSAFCLNQRNSEVLFEIQKAGSTDCFALVNMSSIKTIMDSPVAVYSDFDEFKYKKMNDDKVEWEL